MCPKEEKKRELRQSLEEMFATLESYSKSSNRLDKVERDLFRWLLTLGKQLLLYYIHMVKWELSGSDSEVSDSQGSPMSNKGESHRSYRSVFGELSIRRTKYYSPIDKVCYPLDSALGLPSGKYSYVLDDWLGYGAVEMDFAQSVNLLNRILDQDLSAMQSQRRTYGLSADVESYYEQSQGYEEASDFTHLSVGYDGKGIPIRRSETDRAAESVASRLAKGAKRGVKKEATVSLSSTFKAKVRSQEDVLNSLFSADQTNPRSPSEKHTWHQEKHTRAFLSNKAGAIRYGLEELLKRDLTKTKPIVILIDGDRSLEKTTKEIATEMQMEHRIEAYILDFIHLLEYVWKVANARWGEKHPKRDAWVRQQAKMLLNSQHEEVLKQWEEFAKKPKRAPTQHRNLKAAISYLANRPHMVDYKTYLEKGYPITTGAIESACGHFIKSRMERNAMHWGKIGAQNMLDIRAVKKNQNWDQYLKYYIDREQKALYKNAA